MTTPETLQFFDKIISDYRINIQFNAEVFGMRRLEEECMISDGVIFLTPDLLGASSLY